MKLLTATHLLGKIFGIEVRAMFLLYLFLAAIFLLRALAGGGSANLYRMAALVGVYAISVLLHELGHALAARRAGLRVRGILLHPLGGMAWMVGTPSKPVAEIAIALAGPAVSLCLAALAWLVCWQSDISASQAIYGRDSQPLMALIAGIFFINLSLALFNLLPIFPLDGGRIFIAIAESLLGRQAAVALRRQTAMIGVCLLAGVGLWCWIYQHPKLGILLLLFAYFLFRMARATTAKSDGVGQPGSISDMDSLPTTGDLQARAGQRWWRWWYGWQEKRQQRKIHREAASRADEEKQVDALLAKIKEKGLSSLTVEEIDFLEAISLQWRKEKTDFRDLLDSHKLSGG